MIPLLHNLSQPRSLGLGPLAAAHASPVLRVRQARSSVPDAALTRMKSECGS